MPITSVQNDGEAALKQLEKEIAELNSSVSDLAPNTLVKLLLELNEPNLTKLISAMPRHFNVVQTGDNQTLSDPRFAKLGNLLIDKLNNIRKLSNAIIKTRNEPAIKGMLEKCGGLINPFEALGIISINNPELTKLVISVLDLDSAVYRDPYTYKRELVRAIIKTGDVGSIEAMLKKLWDRRNGGNITLADALKIVELNNPVLTKLAMRESPMGDIQQNHVLISAIIKTGNVDNIEPMLGEFFGDIIKVPALVQIVELNNPILTKLIIGKYLSHSYHNKEDLVNAIIKTGNAEYIDVMLKKLGSFIRVEDAVKIVELNNPVLTKLIIRGSNSHYNEKLVSAIAKTDDAAAIRVLVSKLGNPDNRLFSVIVNDGGEVAKGILLDSAKEYIASNFKDTSQLIPEFIGKLTEEDLLSLYRGRRIDSIIVEKGSAEVVKLWIEKSGIHLSAQFISDVLQLDSPELEVALFVGLDTSHHMHRHILATKILAKHGIGELMKKGGEVEATIIQDIRDLPYVRMFYAVEKLSEGLEDKTALKVLQATISFGPNPKDKKEVNKAICKALDIPIEKFNETEGVSEKVEALSEAIYGKGYGGSIRMPTTFLEDVLKLLNVLINIFEVKPFEPSKAEIDFVLKGIEELLEKKPVSISPEQQGDEVSKVPQDQTATVQQQESTKIPTKWNERVVSASAEKPKVRDNSLTAKDRMAQLEEKGAKLTGQADKYLASKDTKGEITKGV